jgi:hypothetical protein
MRLGLLLLLVALAAGGAVALSAAGGEGRPAPVAAAAPTPTPAVREAEPPPAELPPLPEMRPRVLEPVAGDARGGQPEPEAPAVDPGLSRPGPEPTEAASAGTKRRGPSGTSGSVDEAVALDNGVALPPLEAPEQVEQIIEAGNVIARSPYKWGGGHGRWLDTGYDCSGSVSFALAAAGLLDGPLASGPLMSWGEPGRGKWVTIYANDGHVFMEVAGIRFDTSGRRVTGSRWQNEMRSTSGFVARHPAGL